MYKIIRANETAVVVERPDWVRMQDNGSFALCDEENAHGVVLRGTVYHVDGKPDLPGKDTVIVAQIKETTWQMDQVALADAEKLRVQSALAELSLIEGGTIPTFTAQSGLVSVWVDLIRSGQYTLEQVPEIGNLQQAVQAEVGE